MREILFRGKDIATNEWVYGYLYRLKGVYTISKNIRYDDETPIFIDTVGQYTGIKDKNGEKIFEGDILRKEYKTIDIGKVIFQYGEFTIDVTHLDRPYGRTGIVSTFVKKIRQYSR